MDLGRALDEGSLLHVFDQLRFDLLRVDGAGFTHRLGEKSLEITYASPDVRDPLAGKDAQGVDDQLGHLPLRSVRLLVDFEVALDSRIANAERGRIRDHRGRVRMG